jgi:NAD(P)-dependent dehydrogenase (short-subunit alcohol dehydrogenase family)
VSAEKRAIVVTGASSGIGAATSAQLAERGFVVYAGVRNDADAQRLATIHDNIRPIILDVTNEISIALALRDVRTRGIPLTGLVNNAGIALGGPLETIPLTELRRQFDVNVFGAVAVTQAFLPLLRDRPSRIVLVGSVSGRMPMPYIAPYSASKFALRAIADALRVELAPAHIDVCLIEPGSVATPIWTKGRAQRETMLGRIEPTMPSYYRHATEQLLRGIEDEGRGGMPVSLVANAIVHALTDAKPRARHMLGTSARIGALFALLPARMYDRFIRATMKLP